MYCDNQEKIKILLGKSSTQVFIGQHQRRTVELQREINEVFSFQQQISFCPTNSVIENKKTFLCEKREMNKNKKNLVENVVKVPNVPHTRGTLDSITMQADARAVPPLGEGFGSFSTMSSLCTVLTSSTNGNRYARPLANKIILLMA
ncbi:hypothetical protein GQR58_004540 [Nymphon striatum]|nr:hypothetical protein GQR58_004540 [Nymphon striatum]